MADHKSRVKQLQLTDALRVYPAPDNAKPPRGGWSRAIREALGMTQAQLGERLKISRQAIQDLERAEEKRRITLDSLDRLAHGLGCRVVYALVPERGSLEDVIENRAGELADALLKTTDHSMKLEAQGVSKSERDRQRKLLVESLLRDSPRKLWR